MKVLSIALRELRHYFASPMAYVVTTAFLLITGFFFTTQMASYARNSVPAEYADTLQVILFLTVLICPLLTMRLVAEEKFRGTIETLFTAPVSEFQVLLGKLLGCTLFYIFLVLPTVLYVVMMSHFSPIDFSSIAVGYLGLLLFAVALFSIGLLVSTLFNSQVSAGVVTLVIATILIALHMASSLVEDPGLKPVLSAVSFMTNIGPFFSGRFDSRPVVYFLTICLGCVIASIKFLEARRSR
jgi:ABC-2 type transport system permease protein